MTDAYDKGASEVDAMDLGMHTQLRPTAAIPATAWPPRAAWAVLRFGGKNGPGKEGA